MEEPTAPAQESKGADADVFMGAVQSLSDERLLLLASSVAELRPMGYCPGWSFSCDDASSMPIIQFRHAVWRSCLERRLEKPIVFPWHDGSKFNLYLGNDLSRPTFIGGCFEPNEFAFIGAFLKPGMAVLDVGANEGLYTVFAAQRVGESGEVHAFEPSRREFLRLEANISLNLFANVRLVPKAVAEARGTTELRICEYGHEGQNTLGNFAHEVKQSGTQTVEVCSLDEYFAEHGLSRLDFIKIDVEGSEQRVLEGAHQTISRFKPIILLELNDKALGFQGASANGVVAFLRECGYTIYNFSPSSGCLAASYADPYTDNIVASHGELDRRYLEHSMIM